MQKIIQLLIPFFIHDTFLLSSAARMLWSMKFFFCLWLPSTPFFFHIGISKQNKSVCKQRKGIDWMFGVLS